jgi:AcrR family transcriptional regulator
MTAPAPSRGRPRSDAAHDAILDAAIELIREVGYDAVTMDGIAARAGVGKATVYRRWKAKEPLVCEALERIMRMLPVPNTGTLRGDLRALMLHQAGLYGDPATGPLLSGLVAAMARNERIAGVVRGTFHAARKAAMVAVLRRGIARGELRRGLDLELALDIFNGPLFYRFLFTGQPIDDRLMNGVVDVMLRAFAVETPRARRGR